MRLTASILPVCFFVALALGLGGSSYGSEATTEAVPAGPTTFVIGGLRADPAEPAPAPYSPNVWVEAVFVELDSHFTRRLEAMAGFKLSPQDGKAILTAEDKNKLLAAVEEIEGARIIASLAVMTVSGQQAQSEEVEEVTYPTEYDIEGSKISPGNWEKRDVGAILNVTPMVGKDGRITLVIMPEVTILSGWKEIDGTDVSQPVFRSWNKTTTVVIPDGSTFVLKESPLTPLFRSRALGPPPMGPLGPIEPMSPHRREILKKLDVIIPEIKFENSTLKEVLDYLSRQSDVNIVMVPRAFVGYAPAPGVPGMIARPPFGDAPPPVEDKGITINLKNVPFKDVLRYVLKFKNLTYIEEDHAILVVPASPVPYEARPPEPAGIHPVFPGPEEAKTLLTIISAKVVEAK